MRIMVFGGSGSGKSTLSREIGRRMGVPVVHFDHFYWQAGWVPRPPEKVTELALQAIATEAWVIDGNHSSTMAARAERADLILWMDMPRWLRVGRVLWRVVRFAGRTRLDMASGCPERFSWPFLRDWVLPYDAAGPDSPRARAQSFVAGWQDRRRVVTLRSPAEVRGFLAALPSAQG